MMRNLKNIFASRHIISLIVLRHLIRLIASGLANTNLKLQPNMN